MNDGKSDVPLLFVAATAADNMLSCVVVDSGPSRVQRRYREDTAESERRLLVVCCCLVYIIASRSHQNSRVHCQRFVGVSMHRAAVCRPAWQELLLAACPPTVASVTAT